MSAQELAELDLAVARAEGFIEPYFASTGVILDRQRPNAIIGRPTDRTFAMERLEQYGLTVGPDGAGWSCIQHLDPDGLCERGPTPAIAICRAVVALSAPEARASQPFTSQDATSTTTTPGPSADGTAETGPLVAPLGRELENNT